MHYEINMKVVLSCIFCTLAGWLLAQEPIYFLVADSSLVNGQEKGATTFCSPGILNKSRSRGVDIAFNLYNGGAVRPEEQAPTTLPGQLDALQSIILKVKVPIINKPGLKVLAGFNYSPEEYEFSMIPVSNTFSIASPNYSDVFLDIHSRKLKHTGLGLYVLKPLDERRYLAFRGKVAFNGDYKGLIRFDDRYGSYSATIAYGIKKSEDLEYGFGVGINHNFRRTIALPFFIYNRNFNRRWGLEMVFPGYVNGRYNFNSKTLLLFGYEYQSRAYSLDVENRFTGTESVYHLSHGEVLLGASIERQIVPWVWVNLKAGFQVNQPIRFEAQAPDAMSYRARPANAPYLRFGIFISPPDKRCR